MTKIVLLLIITLPLAVAACGKPASQQGTIPGKPGDDAPKLCAFIMDANLAKRCAVNTPDNTIDVTIDSDDDEAARNACADIAGKAARLTARLLPQWELQVFSPYRIDKPMAACPLHPGVAY